MAKSYAKTYLRIGGRVYRPNEELPEITNEEWKRLTQKHAIVTETDPVQIAIEEPGEDETQGTAPPVPVEAEKPKAPVSAEEAGEQEEDGEDEEEDNEAAEGDGNAPEMPDIDPAESVVPEKKTEGKAGENEGRKKNAPKVKTK